MANHSRESVAVQADQNYFLKKRIGTIVAYVVLGIIALYTLAPLWFLIVNSFKGQAEIINDPLGLPKSFSFSYLSKAFEEIHFLKALFITISLTFASVDRKSVV